MRKGISEWGAALDIRILGGGRCPERPQTGRLIGGASAPTLPVAAPPLSACPGGPLIPATRPGPLMSSLVARDTLEWGGTAYQPALDWGVASLPGWGVSGYVWPYARPGDPAGDPSRLWFLLPGFRASYGAALQLEQALRTHAGSNPHVDMQDELAGTCPLCASSRPLPLKEGPKAKRWSNFAPPRPKSAAAHVEHFLTAVLRNSTSRRSSTRVHK